MRHIFCSFLFVLAFMPLPTLAQESVIKQKNININMDPRMTELDKPYQDIKSTLSPEQVARLDALDTEYTATSAPDVDILLTGAKIAACQQLGFIPANYEQTFITFRDKKNKYQEQLWKDFYKGDVQKIDFVDRKALASHYKYQTMLHLVLTGGLAKASLEQNPVNEGQCKDVVQEVQAYNSASQ